MSYHHERSLIFVDMPFIKEGKMWVMRENEEGNLKKWGQCEYDLQSEKHSAHPTCTSTGSASKDSTNLRFDFLGGGTDNNFICPRQD